MGRKKGRVVVDLRPLNKITIPDSYPLPLQSGIIEAIRGRKYLAIIDATSFFFQFLVLFQFLVHPDHRDVFTIVSHRGRERSTVALMGYRNSPAHVRRYMDRLLHKVGHFCRAFIDDIVIFSETYEEHLEHLDKVFTMFQENGISINPAKSFVGCPSVKPLGFYVDSLGLYPPKTACKASPTCFSLERSRILSDTSALPDFSGP